MRSFRRAFIIKITSFVHLATLRWPWLNVTLWLFFWKEAVHSMYRNAWYFLYLNLPHRTWIDLLQFLKPSYETRINVKVASQLDAFIMDCSKNVLLTFLKMKMCGYILYLMQFQLKTGILHLHNWFWRIGLLVSLASLTFLFYHRLSRL